MVETVDSSPATEKAPLPDRSVVPAVWGRITNLIVDRGEGSWLVTTDGARYLDYSSGIGVTNTGHAHPRVVAAIQASAPSARTASAGRAAAGCRRSWEVMNRKRNSSATETVNPSSW